MCFKEALHANRDENSFTSRLFEYSLFRAFNEDNSFFQKFIVLLKEASMNNRNLILKKFHETNIKAWTNSQSFEYIDGMLFVEIYDIYNYYQKNRSKFNQGYKIEKKLDKTELDCVILCKDSEGKEHLIVFEVKCYTDLKEDEIERQNKWLDELQNVGLFHNYHHFALISIDNLVNAKQIFNSFHLKKCSNGLYVVTWQDFWDRGFLSDSRFFKLDMNLYKEISYKGKEKNKRLLAKTELPDV